MTTETQQTCNDCNNMQIGWCAYHTEIQKKEKKLKGLTWFVSTPYFEQLEENFARAFNLMKAKNRDYASEQDPFKNFRAAELLNISLEKGILLRMQDKMARIGNLVDKPASVVNESVEDTLIDLMNYANILLVYLQTEKCQKQDSTPAEPMPGINTHD